MQSCDAQPSPSQPFRSGPSLSRKWERGKFLITDIGAHILDSAGHLCSHFVHADRD